MTEQIHIVFNPVSGQGEADGELEVVKSSLKGLGQLTVHSTTPEETAEDLAHRAIDQGANLLIASGGDGTISGVASALINTDIPIGIVPRGTVNAFATAMNIPNSISEACSIILNRNVRSVDTARCNNRIMLLLVGIGFEADLMKRIDRQTKDRFGRLAILVSGLRQWQKLNRFQVKIESESQSLEFSASAVTAANAATLKTILAQGPKDIDSSDGYLDITVLTSQSRLGNLVDAADLFISAVLNQDAGRNNVKDFQVSRVKITTEPAQSILIDGELAGETPVELECLKKSLNVFVPSSNR